MTNDALITVLQHCSLHTVSQRNALLISLELCVQQLYASSSQDLSILLETNLPDVLATYIKSNTDMSKIDEVSELLRTILAEIKSISPIHITLANYPRELFLNKLVSYLTEKLNTFIILDLTISPLILGGLTLEYRGNFFDHSLKNIIDKFTSEYF